VFLTALSKIRPAKKKSVLRDAQRFFSQIFYGRNMAMLVAAISQISEKNREGIIKAVEGLFSNANQLEE